LLERVEVVVGRDWKETLRLGAKTSGAGAGRGMELAADIRVRGLLVDREVVLALGLLFGRTSPRMSLPEGVARGTPSIAFRQEVTELY